MRAAATATVDTSAAPSSGLTIAAAINDAGAYTDAAAAAGALGRCLPVVFSVDSATTTLRALLSVVRLTLRDGDVTRAKELDALSAAARIALFRVGAVLLEAGTAAAQKQEQPADSTSATTSSASPIGVLDPREALRQLAHEFADVLDEERGVASALGIDREEEKRRRRRILEQQQEEAYQRHVAAAKSNAAAAAAAAGSSSVGDGGGARATMRNQSFATTSGMTPAVGVLSFDEMPVRGMSSSFAHHNSDAFYAADDHGRDITVRPADAAVGTASTGATNVAFTTTTTTTTDSSSRGASTSTSTNAASASTAPPSVGPIGSGLVVAGEADAGGKKNKRKPCAPIDQGV
jgi:hypothetical protein